jgi:hypothetical protein
LKIHKKIFYKSLDFFLVLFRVEIEDVREVPKILVLINGLNATMAIKNVQVNCRVLEED